MANKPRPAASAGASLHDHLADAPAIISGFTAKSLETHLYYFLQQAGCLEKNLLLAFSGGLDSRVLLQLLVAIKPFTGFDLRAMHVHHGLSPNADQWAAFCAATCSELGVPLQMVRVEIDRNDKRGLEAAARSARYQALLEADCDHVVLAHHEDDQAETLLLQLLRGAGIKGLAAMSANDAGKRLLRPLLAISREELQRYAEAQNLQWIDDESNDDIAYDRNYCRHQILPVVLKRFPAAKATLARSAAHLAEAAQLLDALAAIDAEHIIDGSQLRISGLAALTAPRARNLLRWWLSAHQCNMPSTAVLDEMLRQLINARPDAQVKLEFDGMLIRRYRDNAHLQPVFSQPEATIADVNLMWQGEAEMRLADGSKLYFECTTGKGLAIKDEPLALRIATRCGGERFKPDTARPARTLKNLMQEAGMPPWLRQRLPLIYSGDTLAVVPGIGVASDLQAAPDELGLTITWQP